jgi:hypothetical protein
MPAPVSDTRKRTPCSPAWTASIRIAPPGGSELDGVAHEVREHLHGAPAITADRGEIRGHRALDAELPRLGREPHRDERLLDEGGGVLGSGLDRDPARLDVGRLEQIADQAIHDRDGVEDRVELSAVGLVCAGELHRLRAHANAPERVPEIVRDDREQVIARANGGVQRLAQPGDLQRGAGALREQLRGAPVLRGEALVGGQAGHPSGRGLPAELRVRGLVGEVEVPDGPPAEEDRHAEEAPHLDVVRWSPRERRVLPHVPQVDRGPLQRHLPEHAHRPRRPAERP